MSLCWRSLPLLTATHTPLNSPGTLVPTGASRSRSALASAELLEAPGSSELPTENWSLIIAPWCCTSRESWNSYVWQGEATAGCLRLPGLLSAQLEEQRLSRDPPPQLPALLPLQPPLWLTDHSPLQGFPAKAAWLTPLPNPSQCTWATGLHTCDRAWTRWKSHWGQRMGRTHPPHAWVSISGMWWPVPPPALIPLPYFPLQQALLAPEHAPVTSLIPPGIFHPGSHPLSPSSQESERSWKLCCCLLE